MKLICPPPFFHNQFFPVFTYIYVLTMYSITMIFNTPVAYQHTPIPLYSPLTGHVTNSTVVNNTWIPPPPFLQTICSCLHLYWLTMHLTTQCSQWCLTPLKHTKISPLPFLLSTYVTCDKFHYSKKYEFYTPLFLQLVFSWLFTPTYIDCNHALDNYMHYKILN